jgi:ornithine cyclodeaminase
MLARADVVVADSRAQCRLRGEIHHALATQVLAEDRVVELGDVVAGRAPGRTAQDQITIADLTGVAVQDMAIAALVYEALQHS